MVLVTAGLGAQGPALSLGLTLGPLYASDNPGPGLNSSLKSTGVLVPPGAPSLGPSSPAHSAAPPKVPRGVRAPHSRSPCKGHALPFPGPTGRCDRLRILDQGRARVHLVPRGFWVLGLSLTEVFEGRTLSPHLRVSSCSAGHMGAAAEPTIARPVTGAKGRL